MNDSFELTTADRTLADLVTADSRAARVLEGFGLDFCCNGRRTLREAADARGIPVAAVTRALAVLGTPGVGDVTSDAWRDLRLLVRHIVDRHHAYVRAATPALVAWLDRLVERHGPRHPELQSLRETFLALAAELETHMLKEETILFPYINEVMEASESGRLVPGPFGTILHPIRVMEADHALAGELLARLRTLSGGFTAPAGACATFNLCYEELSRFEHDLHQHIHLENNVLFPRAAELEQQLMVP